jgi:hypothetical protein
MRELSLAFLRIDQGFGIHQQTGGWCGRVAVAIRRHLR